MGIRGSSSVVKRPVCKADHSPSSIVEVKIEWSYTSTPSIRRKGADRDCTFFFTQSCFNWHASNLCNMDNGSYKYCPPVLLGTKLLPNDKQEGSKYVSHSKGKSL